MKCNLCQEEKEEKCFRPSKTSSKGVNITCRTCQNKASKELMKRKNAFFKEYFTKCIKTDTTECQHCNETKIRIDFPRYNSICKVCMKVHFNNYKITPDEKERRIQYKKEYNQYFKEKKQEALKLFNQNKPVKDCHKSDQWKLANRIRNDLRLLLKGMETKRLIKLIGCSYEELKAYIESLWKEGMTWENYGKHGWHLDHKIPCASFDLTDEKQLAFCAHYTNLQPLWAQENWSKGFKIE